MEIQLELNKGLFVPKFYPLLFDYSHRWEVYNGSAGSAKSYFITQKLLIRAINEPIKILVCRRYASTIRNTCFSLFKDIIAKWKLTPYVKIRESDFNISFPNGSEIIFMGLDEETKLLSLNNIGCIFVEEAYEVPKSIVEQLNLRLRGKTANQQIIMAFNPISKNSWLHDFCEVNPPTSFLYTHSTYEDNPFLSAAYVAELDEMKIRNPQKARVFCYGEWGVDSEGLVFQNWRTEEFDEMELAKNLDKKVGVDFGWTDPSAVVCSFYDKDAKRIYIYDEFIQSGLQLDELARIMAEKRLSRTVIFCDSAEPRSIEFLKSKGFAAKPCLKGPDSVDARLAFLQNHEIIIHPRCRKLIEEFENFSYIRDKDGNWTEKTTHEFSHGIDALGYAYSDIYKRQGVRSVEKAALGL